MIWIKRILIYLLFFSAGVVIILIDPSYKKRTEEADCDCIGFVVIDAAIVTPEGNIMIKDTICNVISMGPGHMKIRKINPSKDVTD
jgi:hypothetical protein